MDFRKKVSRSELPLSWEGTYKRPKALITKSVGQKYHSRSSLPDRCFFQTKGSRKPRRCKKKNPRWRAKSERPLVVSLTICEVNEMHL